MSDTKRRKIALVTGANQGLGLALVRGLCRVLGESGTVYLGARDEARGGVARDLLRSEGLRPELMAIDVGEDASVQAAADAVRARHGGIDIVVSNAAQRISKDIPSAEQVIGFVSTNNHGTCRIMRAFVPLLRDNARFIVVASSFGSLRNLDASLHPKFDGCDLTLDAIEQAMDEYAAAVRSGTAASARWPDWINVPSKIGQVAAVRVLARDGDAEFRRRGILVNAACPGLVDSDASRPWFDDMSKAASPDEAARDLIWLATLPPTTTQPYGELVRNRLPLPWK
ncbi:MAG: SDR family NAD(P)-dependent oxidoreductase [Reyranella sp.]|nr:SDR family NAD(P)-dependent oxidoreductase [Reyranella sp.]